MHVIVTHNSLLVNLKMAKPRADGETHLIHAKNSSCILFRIWELFVTILNGKILVKWNSVITNSVVNEH
jgi:hypothetical protein